MKKSTYATIRRYEGIPDNAKAAAQVEKVFVPLISKLPGFVEYYWIDLGSSAMLSVTVFKTLADAVAANERSREWVKEHLSDVLPKAARMEAGRIVAHKGHY